MVSAPYGSITSEIQCNVANIHNHRHYCKYENCRWHNLRSTRKVFSLIILLQKTSLVYVGGSMSFVTHFLNVALRCALCNLQISFLRKFTYRPALQDDDDDDNDGDGGGGGDHDHHHHYTIWSVMCCTTRISSQTTTFQHCVAWPSRCWLHHTSSFNSLLVRVCYCRRM